MENTLTKIGKLGLEGLMDRANIAFTSGYRFQGILNVELLQHSIDAICQQIDKFSFEVEFKAQNNYQWRPIKQPNFPLQIIESDNLALAFQQLCQQSHQIFSQLNQVPMFFSFIRDTNQSTKETTQTFIIAQTNNHTYVDARSAETIFNKVIAHYNALHENKLSLCHDIIASAARLKTVDSHQIIKQRFQQSDAITHQNNVNDLEHYTISDLGQHAIARSQLSELLPRYQAAEHKPHIQFFNIEKMLASTRSQFKNVTRNSVVCAAVVKAFYHINVQERGVSPQHSISFKMLSDILSTKMRQQFSGNYIAFVPVTVNAAQPIEAIAKEIDDYVIHFKKSCLDVSVFSLTESAINDGLVGTADEPLSFIITNWNNFTFTSSNNFLAECQSIQHQSGVNISPKDNLGAALVNRPVLVVNFSPDGELCLSQFPSLASKAVNQTISKHCHHVFSAYR